MEVTTINSRIIKTELIKWRDLDFIQQENFKEWINGGDTKLIESILKYQFIDAFRVWEHDGKLFCLDADPELRRMREVEAIKLRTEINKGLRDISVIKKMYPNA